MSGLYAWLKLWWCPGGTTSGRLDVLLSNVGPEAVEAIRRTFDCNAGRIELPELRVLPDDDDDGGGWTPHLRDHLRSNRVLTVAELVASLERSERAHERRFGVDLRSFLRLRGLTA